MDKMIKRKKDEGFTLIELMIVIAVIGILAIVLVPKVGSIKTQAKGAGLDTNIRVVEGYVHSKIDKWVNKGTTDTEVRADIVKAFTGDAKLTNPFTSESSDAEAGSATAAEGAIDNVPLFVISNGVVAGDITQGVTVLSETNTKGTVVVSINGSTAPIKNITIYAYGSDGELIPEKTVTIAP